MLECHLNFISKAYSALCLVIFAEGTGEGSSDPTGNYIIRLDQLAKFSKIRAVAIYWAHVCAKCFVYINPLNLPHIPVGIRV